MSLGIQLLGSPTIERDGARVQPPRGHKHWGLLAYLVCSRVPPSRERIAGMLFSEADDPLGALRSALTATRRALGRDVELGGDPLRLALPPGTALDLDILARGSWVEAVSLPGLGHELLDGIVFRSSPGFEIWLENERRQVAGTTSAVLRQAALALLARGDASAAARRASELVQLNRYDENAHALLVRCLYAAGEHDAARQQVAACLEMFRSELGVEPGVALREADVQRREQAPARPVPQAAIRAQIETGEAIIGAGATEAGLERLRNAAAAARSGDDTALLARSLITLGGALVHGARGTDVEGAAALHEGTILATRAGDDELAATAWREIGWVQFLRAEYARAERSLASAAALPGISDVELAWVDLLRGTCRADVGDPVAAEPLFLSAVERSRRLGTTQPLAYALTFFGRFRLLRGEADEATCLLDEALECVEVGRLTAFRPWPESFRADLDLASGDIDEAERRFDRAFAVGCEVGDPCWESIGMRGRGLVAAARGDVPGALEMLTEAPRLCRRLPDTYLWIETYGLDALCDVAVRHGAAAASLWIAELEQKSARRGMRELLFKAMLYRAQLGAAGAAEAALSLAAELDNPLVDELLDSIAARAAA